MTETKTRPAGLAVLGWKPMRKNTLRGFAVVRLSSGLTIHNVAVHTSSGCSWASLPSKPMLDADGAAKRDKATGRIKYLPILEWPDRATADRFSATVIDAIEAQHPGAIR